jgi:hypothetical protein
MNEQILSLEVAERLLLPYIGVFRDSLLTAYACWRDRPEDERRYLSDQARAFYIHDMAVGIATAELKGTKVLTVESNSLKLFNVEDKALVRLAKFGPALTTSKNHTHQQRDFDHQLPLPGLELACNLVAGYVLDALETCIERVAIVCPHGDGNLWSFDVDLGQAEGGTLLDLHRTPDDGPLPVIIKSRMEKLQLPSTTTDAE